MAYLGAFHFLHSLNLADCYKVNSAALWAITGMISLSSAITLTCPLSLSTQPGKFLYFV